MSFSLDRLCIFVYYAHIDLHPAETTVPSMDVRTICVRRSLTVKTIIEWRKAKFERWKVKP